MNKLNLPAKLFKEYYPKVNLTWFTIPPASKKEFLSKQLTSKLWRMNNLYTIVDKDGDRVPFIMNSAQHKVYAAFLIHPRLVILKSRQRGISTFWLIFFFDSAVFGDDLNIGLMAQGKSESAKLLKKVKLAWEELDESIKSFLQIMQGKNNTEEFSFSNGSTIYISTSFRSATLQGLHISEFGKIANKYPERARETKTGSMQAIKPGLPVAIESTAEGANEFKRIWDIAADHLLQGLEFSGKDFYPVFLSWIGDDDCVNPIKQAILQWQADYFDRLEEELNVKLTNKQKWFWIMQYRELGDDIYQEYPSTAEEAFTVTKDGSYYAKLYRECVIKRRREIDGLYDPNLEVSIAMDLGMNDTFVLVFFQRWRKERRIIHEYYNSGEGLEHYVNYINSTGYKICRVILPHDIKVRELSTGQSRLHRLRELGVRRTKVLPRIAVNDGIEAVRRMMPDLYIDPSCEYIIKCLKNYSKQWDEKLGVWKDTPLHDEHSNGADGIRYMAIGDSKQTVQRDKTENLGGTVVDGLCI